MHSRQWILLSALLAGCGGSVDLEPSTEDAGADSAVGPTLGAACSPVDDPQVAPEVEAAHSRLAQQSREANVALATAGALNGVPWFERATLVADGIRAAQSVLSSEESK